MEFSFFFICQDNLFLKREIFEKHFFNFYYLNLLSQVNKQFYQIALNIKQKQNEFKYRENFYSLVNDFISREDFETLNIQFTFENYNLFAIFSFFGLLNSIKYLYEKNPKTKKIKRKDNQEIKWDEESCFSAASNGHLHILEYLRENNCPWDKRSCCNASWYGHLHILKYLHENSCPWGKMTCRNASLKGHLHILKYLHENGCPWDKWCCYYAAMYGHLDILKYLHENNSPYVKQICSSVAKNKEIKEYIEKYM